MDGDKSAVKERWELGNDQGVEVPRESIRHRSNKGVRKSSRRDEKRSKDRERFKESEKERVSSIDTRKEGRDDDRTREKGRDKDGDFDKYRQSNRRQRDRERKNHDWEREFLKDSPRGHDKEGGKETSKEERLKKTSSDTLSWVNKKRNAEKERALQLSRVFEEQDNINQRDDTEDEAAAHHTCHDLSGLHGLLDKVIQGGAVVLTLKDQTIRANGDMLEDVDMETLIDSSAKTSSDYYTHQEMLLFKKPKKIKSLRKKDKLDLDALEAEAVSVGLGINDLGSTSNGKRRQALKEEQEKSEAEKRNSAYQSAHARAQEASNALRPERRTTLQPMEEDDDADLRKSLERARKLALEKQPSAPQAIALVASSAATNSGADKENTLSGEPQENKLVFTEMEEFVWGLQLGKEAHKPEAPGASVVEKKAEQDGGWTEMQKVEIPSKEKEEDIAWERTIHEVAVGKGLSGALNLLKDRGTLKESVEWAPKEAFRLISHKFHGKGPGKMKQEKRMRQYEEELKVKKMKNSDTPSLFVERTREAQAQLMTPYLVLSGNVKTRTKK